MMRRFFAYLRKVYAFEALLCELRDERRTRHISTAAVCRAVFLMFVLRLGSLNALEQYPRRRASARISFLLPFVGVGSHVPSSPPVLRWTELGWGLAKCCNKST